MRPIAILLASLVILPSFAKEVKDTVWTIHNDKIILTYNVSLNDNHLSLDFSPPRIIPSSTLNKECKGELNKLKVVIFDRIGDFGKTKWSGMSPSAFIVADGLAYENTSDGYYILGESQLIEFNKTGRDKVDINLPLYIAVYEKKQKYRIVSSSKEPLRISSAIEGGKSSGQSQYARQGTGTETIAVTSIEESEADNRLITSALSNIALIKQLLDRETEFPISQALQMEINNLKFLKNQITDPEVLDKITDVLVLCSDKEHELKKAKDQSDSDAKAREEIIIRQQKQEAEAQQKAAEEKAKEQEEKQQKRTLWMIIGGVGLAVLGFIGNAVLKHFRDIRNQNSIMQMQESLARQAEHEAGRRSREIIRNKAHQAANNGRNKLRESVNKTSKQSQNTKRRSI